MAAKSSALPTPRCGEFITFKPIKHFCPECYDHNVYKSTRWTRFFTLFIIGIATFWFMAGLPFLIAAPFMLFTPTRYKCDTCRTTFNQYEYQKKQLSYLRKVGQPLAFQSL